MSQVPIPTLTGLGQLSHIKFKEAAKQAFDYLQQTQEVSEKGDPGQLASAIVNIANNSGSTILFEVLTPPGMKVKDVSVLNPPDNVCVDIEIESDTNTEGDSKYYQVNVNVPNPGSGEWEIVFKVYTYSGDDDTSAYEGKWVFVKSSTKPDEEPA